MNVNETIKLGALEFPVGEFTLGELQKLIPLFANADTATVPGIAAMATALHVAAKRTMPEMTFEEFQKIHGLTIQQMILAFRQVGLKIGFFQLAPAAAPVIDAVAQTADESAKTDFA